VKMRHPAAAVLVLAGIATWSVTSAAQPSQPRETAAPAGAGAMPNNATANGDAPSTSMPEELDEGTIGSPRGARRWLTIAYNPFTLQASRYGANAELLLASHHVIAGTLYWANTVTNEDSFKNRFRGVGGELGYRYYTGHDGPRGIFIGPSLLLAALEAVPARGATTSFENYGVALDVGYQALVADRWVVGLGGGLQYNRPSTTFPQQELPASIYANPGVRPRLLLALGVAF
jgi:hypothetical protein